MGQTIQMDKGSKADLNSTRPNEETGWYNVPQYR